MTEETLKTKLEGLTSRTAYAFKLPEKATLPALTYKRIASQVDLSHSGSGLSHTRYEINCWANDYSTALIDGSKVLAGLNGNKSDFQTSWVINTMDELEQDTNIYRTIIEVMVLN